MTLRRRDSLRKPYSDNDPMLIIIYEQTLTDKLTTTTTTLSLQAFSFVLWCLSRGESHCPWKPGSERVKLLEALAMPSCDRASQNISSVSVTRLLLDKHGWKILLKVELISWRFWKRITWVHHLRCRSFETARWIFTNIRYADSNEAGMGGSGSGGTEDFFLHDQCLNLFLLLFNIEQQSVFCQLCAYSWACSSQRDFRKPYCFDPVAPWPLRDLWSISMVDRLSTSCSLKS